MQRTGPSNSSSFAGRKSGTSIKSSSAPASARRNRRRGIKLTIAAVASIGIIVVISIIARQVVLKHKLNQSTSAPASKTESIQLATDSKLSDINFDHSKVNIYLFRGEGCSHCAELYSYLESIWPTYGKYARLYAFEIWNNEDNGRIMDWFLEQTGHQAGNRSTPTFIIGDKFYRGFSENDKADIKQTITDKYENRDKIKDFSAIKDSGLSN